MDIDTMALFSKRPQALPLYEAIREKIVSEFANVSIRVLKTQVVFSNRHNFAYVWMPAWKIKGRPDVYVILSFGLGYQVKHPRILESTEPYPRRWTHHVLIQSEDEVDSQIMEWIAESYHFANAKR